MLSAALLRRIGYSFGKKTKCPICAYDSDLLDKLDLNKSCEENQGKYLPLAHRSIAYYLCANCQFCFAPECADWSLEEFERKIYNDDYINIDPEYPEQRPARGVLDIQQVFEKEKHHIKHLDYGGGNGRVSQLLNEAGWQSSSYDPFVHRDISIKTLGKFDLITAFEVFEHVPDVNVLMANLSSLLRDDGIIFFTTLLSDGKIHSGKKLEWWYAAPRNGHISLFSSKSLIFLAEKNDFLSFSSSDSGHIFLKCIPKWAERLFSMA